MKMVLIHSCLRGFFFFFSLYKNGVFGFQNYFVLWNTIVKLMKVVFILVPSSEGVSPGNFLEIYIKRVYSGRILRF